MSLDLDSQAWIGTHKHGSELLGMDATDVGGLAWIKIDGRGLEVMGVDWDSQGWIGSHRHGLGLPGPDRN